MENLGVINNKHRWEMKQIFSAYIMSKEWKALVKAVYIRDFNQCVDCGEHRGNSKRKFFVHHTSYDNWGFGDFRELKDVVLVCDKCHNKRHRDNSIKVPFWACRKDEISPEILFNKREILQIYHPFNGKEVKLI